MLLECWATSSVQVAVNSSANHIHRVASAANTEACDHPTAYEHSKTYRHSIKLAGILQHSFYARTPGGTRVELKSSAYSLRHFFKVNFFEIHFHGGTELLQELTVAG